MVPVDFTWLTTLSCCEAFKKKKKKGKASVKVSISVCLCVQDTFGLFWTGYSAVCAFPSDHIPNCNTLPAPKCLLSWRERPDWGLFVSFCVCFGQPCDLLVAKTFAFCFPSVWLLMCVYMCVSVSVCVCVFYLSYKCSFTKAVLKALLNSWIRLVD